MQLSLLRQCGGLGLTPSEASLSAVNGRGVAVATRALVYAEETAVTETVMATKSAKPPKDVSGVERTRRIGT